MACCPPGYRAPATCAASDVCLPWVSSFRYRCRGQGFVNASARAPLCGSRAGFSISSAGFFGFAGGRPPIDERVRGPSAGFVRAPKFPFSPPSTTAAPLRDHVARPRPRPGRPPPLRPGGVRAPHSPRGLKRPHSSRPPARARRAQKSRPFQRGQRPARAHGFQSPDRGRAPRSSASSFARWMPSFILSSRRAVTRSKCPRPSPGFRRAPNPGPSGRRSLAVANILLIRAKTSAGDPSQADPGLALPRALSRAQEGEGAWEAFPVWQRRCGHDAASSVPMRSGADQ